LEKQCEQRFAHHAFTFQFWTDIIPANIAVAAIANDDTLFKIFAVGIATFTFTMQATFPAHLHGILAPLSWRAFWM